MPYSSVDLVDFSAQKEIEKLETVFKDLADIRVQGLLSKTQERVGAFFSPGQNDEGDE